MHIEAFKSSWKARFMKKAMHWFWIVVFATKKSSSFSIILEKLANMLFICTFLRSGRYLTWAWLYPGFLVKSEAMSYFHFCICIIFKINLSGKERERERVSSTPDACHSQGGSCWSQGPRAQPSSPLGLAGVQSHHLLPPRLHKRRKLKLGTELGLFFYIKIFF